MKPIKSYDMYIQPITPIHIGTGEHIYPYEYVIKNSILYKIEFSEFYSQLKEEEQEELLKYIESNLVKFRETIKKLYSEKYGYIYKANISESLKRNYNEKLGGAKNKNDESQLEIAEAIKSRDMAYIPGSTIKGSIRSAYIPYKKGKISYIVKQDTRGRRVVIDGDKYAEGRITDELMDKHGVQMDAFKMVKVSDTQPITDSLSINDVVMYTYKRKLEEFEKGMAVYQETTKSLYGSNTKLIYKGQIQFFEGYYTKGKLNRNGINLNITKDDIVSAMREKAKLMISKEKSFFKNNGDLKETLMIYEKLEELQKELGEDEVLMRMGKGAGFDSTTWNLFNEKIGIQTVSRNLAREIYPMGWAILSIKEKGTEYKGKIDDIKKEDIKEKLKKEVKEEIKKRDKKIEKKGKITFGEFLRLNSGLKSFSPDIQVGAFKKYKKDHNLS